jgi:hypothetical protein
MVAPFTMQRMRRAELSRRDAQGATALGAKRLYRLQGEVVAPAPSRQKAAGSQRAQYPGSVRRQNTHDRRDEQEDQPRAHSPGNPPRSRARADKNPSIRGLESEENDANRDLEDTIDFGVGLRSQRSGDESFVAVEGCEAVMYVADSIPPRCLAPGDRLDRR